MSSSEHQFDVIADFHQFVVCDALAGWSTLADHWTADTVREMFVQGHGFVGIGTARDSIVPVMVSVGAHPTAPSYEPDRSASGWIDIPSGRLVVTGVTDNGASGGEISVEPGEYDVLVRYYGLDSVDPDGLNGRDRYVVHIWPRRRQDSASAEITRTSSPTCCACAAGP